MEDDDEFGDLYTDVLRAFPSSSDTPQPHQSSPPKPPSLNRPIDLNFQIDDEDTLFGAPNNFNSTISQQSTDQTVVPDRVELVRDPIVIGIGNCGRNSIAVGSSEDQEVGTYQDLSWGEKNLESEPTELGESRVLEKEDVKLRDGSLKIVNYDDKSGVVGVGDKEGDENGGLLDKSVNFDDEVHDNVKFDVEEDQYGVGNMGSDELLIPGLSSGGPSLIPGVSGERKAADASVKEEQSGEGDDWDSDSEDDLQIVLNDDNHGPMAMDGVGVVGSDDEDEDGDPLVIVADGDDPNHQAMEEQEWGGEDGAQAADGERKEMGDGVKGNVGMAVPPKIVYSNHGYHPFHSQFKYVRPGTAPMTGVATMGPGGAPGQVRPLINMGPTAGRGRGDWRPPGIKNGHMQKGFHPGFGMPAWGNGPLGRGYGGGPDFTLPSHKTIFEVDIDSFEEKPWKYPGVDITDFFNFGLNEESWKDYCKQLEQLRLESTMQSKIRVYESGRTEQDYDPDMPPELAAATGINDVTAENANTGKTDVGQSDFTKGSAQVRPPLPTGRAIQVESGYGERLPSIDTRPPRIRDSDAIIEIILQDSLEDESSTGNGILEHNNSPKEDLKKECHSVEVDTEYADDLPHTYNGRKRELVGRRAPFMNSVHDDTAEGNGILPFPQGASLHPDSRGQSPVYPSTNFGIPGEERRRRGRQHDRSPKMTVSQSSRDKFLDNEKGESLESMDGKHSPISSSPATVRAADEPSFEQIDAVDNELGVADGSSEMEADEMPPNTMATAANSPYCKKKQKLISRVEHHKIQEADDGDDLKATRSSENSKVRSGSNGDCQKLRDSVEDEDIQDRSSTRIGNIKKHLDDDEQSFRKRDRDGRSDMERKRVVVKGREDAYAYRDWDPNSSHTSRMKTEILDRRKERNSSDGVWQRRDEDQHGRRIRTEDSRKRDFGDEMGPMHGVKIRDSDRSDKDENLLLRKQLDNGSWRGHHDKDSGSRHRERDDTSKGRYENMDDYYSKRRKDEEHLRREHADKEEILLGHRESTGHRKRERDEILDQRRRDSQPRLRDNLDDHHSVRQKDEGWLQRERSEKQRDERHRLKQSPEVSLSKREREDGRAVVGSGRGAEDKLWISHSRAKDENKDSDKDYKIKDTGRHSEPLKRRDRIEDESLSHHRRREDVYPRGNQISNEERKSRQERLSTRNDRAHNVSDNQRVHDKKPKENTRNNRDSEGFDYSTSGISKRNQEYHSGQRNETVSMKGTILQEKEMQETSLHRQSSRKHRENASSEDEQQDSRRGRSKLERWTSHKERDFSINSKSSSSRVKEIDRNNNGGSSLSSKLPDDSAKSLEAADNQLLVEEKEAGDLEIKDSGSKPVEDRHLDTVAKLKKRSERFKLPMPIEKEVMTTKKMESEPLPKVESEVTTTADTEIKQERPARKRRWVSK